MHDMPYVGVQVPEAKVYSTNGVTYTNMCEAICNGESLESNKPCNDKPGAPTSAPPGPSAEAPPPAPDMSPPFLIRHLLQRT